MMSLNHVLKVDFIPKKSTHDVIINFVIMVNLLNAYDTHPETRQEVKKIFVAICVNTCVSPRYGL